MDGTLAVIFFILSLTDMGVTDCPTGCLRAAEADRAISLQASAVEFQERIIGEELLLGYDFGRSYGPWQPTTAISATTDGDLWIGLGAKWTTQDIFNSPLFIEASFLPGLHRDADGPDLGGSLQFRSALGVGYEFDNGMTVLASYDHRSNGDTRSLNPGLETISLRLSIPLE